MSELSLIIAAVVADGALRQVFVLSAIVRSGQFLRQRQDIRPPSPAGERLAPRFFIVVPVLREAALLRETVAHFRTLACGQAATVSSSPLPARPPRLESMTPLATPSR